MLEILMVHGQVCPTCRRMLPIFKQVAEKYKSEDIKFKDDDISVLIPYLQERNVEIQMLPSFVFLENNKPVDIRSGAMSFDEFCNIVDGILC